MTKNLYSLSLTVLILAMASCGRVAVPSQTTSLGDQQEPAYRQQTEAAATVQAEQAQVPAAANLEEAHTAASATDASAAHKEQRSTAKTPKLEKIGRAQRISRKDPFGDRYVQANQYSVGVHSPPQFRERSLLYSSAIMMAAPAAAYAQARQRYDFSDPLYLALFIILVILLVILGLLVIAETISAFGLVGVLLLALLIILLVILL